MHRAYSAQLFEHCHLDLRRNDLEGHLCFWHLRLVGHTDSSYIRFASTKVGYPQIDRHPPTPVLIWEKGW